MVFLSLDLRTVQDLESRVVYNWVGVGGCVDVCVAVPYNECCVFPGCVRAQEAVLCVFVKSLPE